MNVALTAYDARMQLALYRDKDGRTVYQYPFILVIDPIMNQGRLYPDETAVVDDFLDDDLMDDSDEDNVLPMLAARGWRVYYLRSDADMEDEILPYFAIADGQLQEIMSARWVQQDHEFPGAEHVDWTGTTTKLYTDGEKIICEGHVVRLVDDAPDREGLEAKVRTWLDAYATEVASELRAKLIYRTPRQPTV